ncbi:unnamed protein product [Mesocestoides corti]|uniref:Uncharacterized protein n=1 Tax=Mesocestoides corti TaxID=53468 RepID=A0A3P6HTI6_MESCO|nr:unnamed protein product [Mesocestoides corti]
MSEPSTHPRCRGLILLLLLLLSPTFYLPPLHFLHLLLPPVQSIPLQCDARGIDDEGQAGEVEQEEDAEEDCELIHLN